MKIAEDSINEELHYSLNYIVQDLHKIGHEIIKKRWFNNANSLLFYIAKLGVLAENKKIVKPYSFHSLESKDYWYHDFAEILKDLFEKFTETFGKKPFQKSHGDFFTELRLESYNSDPNKFIQYYEDCNPNKIIIEDLKEEP